jgi:hypothetical protein
MCLTPALKNQIINLNPPHVSLAHNILLANGYEFVGYHGCNRTALISIITFGLDPARSGTGAGNARGPGFYVSRRRQLAVDWADSITQDGDPLPPLYNAIPRRNGDDGVQQLLRIYAKSFQSMTLNLDYAWGVQSSDGDPNGDRGIESAGGQDHVTLAADLEIVFRSRSYPRIAAIPSLGEQWDDEHLAATPQAQWRAHTDDDSFRGRPRAVAARRAHEWP